MKDEAHGIKDTKLAPKEEDSSTALQPKRGENDRWHDGDNTVDITTKLKLQDAGSRSACLRVARAVLATFDAAKARCFLDEDRQHLLAVIEASFGTFAPFNAAVRLIFEERIVRARLAISV